MELGLEMAYRVASTIVFFNALLIFSLSAAAASPGYFTVREGASKLQETPEISLSPVYAFAELTDRAAKKIVELSLLDWEHHTKDLPQPTKPYNRLKQYGPWADDHKDGTCHNTRAKALIRASESEVDFSRSGCTVLRGKWQDPYSNRQYTDAMDLQIDHVVPLKNSYISGGWKWDANKRCLYANFLENEFHLLVVNGNDNMQKGDRTPEKYMPPNKAFACEYLADWLKIKLIWNLAMTPSEGRAISELAKENNCDEAALTMRVQDLHKQRQRILDNMQLCRASE